MKGARDRLGSVRSSALIGREGVGAIVEEGATSYVVSPIDRWLEHGADVSFPASERVLQLLSKKQLRKFSVSDDKQKPTDGMIPTATRFPRALVCMKCDRLFAYGAESESTECTSCKGNGRSSKLIGVNWVMICHRGHLDDIWWSGLAHRDELSSSDGARANCKSDLRLFLTSRDPKRRPNGVPGSVRAGSGAGQPIKGLNMYTNQIVICGDCGASSDLSSLRTAATSVRKCRNRDPWGDDDDEARNGAHCAWAILRSSTQILQTSSASFLDIGGMDDVQQEIEQQSSSQPSWHSLLEDDIFATGYRDHVRMTADPEEKVRLSGRFANQLVERTEWNGAEPTVQEISAWLRGDRLSEMTTTEIAPYQAATDYESRLDEWRVLAEGNLARRSLLLEQRRPPTERGISILSAVKRFREIRVPLGYSRVHLARPDAAPHQCENPVKCAEKPMNRGISDGNEDWLPAHEVFGEGVFLELDGGIVRSVVDAPEYAEKHVAPALALAEHPLLTKRLDLKIILAPAFPLVHTFSHLLLRELAFVAGYALPSLRERIFVHESQPKAGLLIYTADGDSEGSLGGLVRLATDALISKSISKLMVRASWCPQDPICWESSTTGSLGLNRATCHGCTIIPETSCAHSNLRLDRQAVVNHEYGMQRSLNVPGGRHG